MPAISHFKGEICNRKNTLPKNLIYTITEDVYYDFRLNRCVSKKMTIQQYIITIQYHHYCVFTGASENDFASTAADSTWSCCGRCGTWYACCHTSTNNYEYNTCSTSDSKSSSKQDCKSCCFITLFVACPSGMQLFISTYIFLYIFQP